MSDQAVINNIGNLDERGTSYKEFSTSERSVSSLDSTRCQYRRLDALGYVAHMGAAVCALVELVEDFEQLNEGEGVLLLLLSRVCREYSALRGAVEKAEDDLEEAGLLCSVASVARNACDNLLNLKCVALILTLGGLVASLADLFWLDEEGH